MRYYAILIEIILLVYLIIMDQNALKIKKEQSLQTALGLLKTGDIILFRWNTVSHVKQLFVNSQWTHVGVVWKRGNGDLYICESHEAGDADYLDISTGGVHLHPLAERLSLYPGDVAVRYLNKPLNDDHVERFTKEMRKMIGVKFDDDHPQHIVKNCMIGSVVPFMQDNPDDYKLTFCSQFAAHMLKSAQIFKINSTCALPSHLSSRQSRDIYINGYEHGMETMVKRFKDHWYKDSKIQYVLDIVHKFITFYLIFGGIIAYMMDSSEMLFVHGSVLVFTLLQWTVYNNTCFISEFSDHGTTGYSSSLAEKVGLPNSAASMDLINYGVITTSLFLTAELYKRLV